MRRPPFYSFIYFLIQSKNILQSVNVQQFRETEIRIYANSARTRTLRASLSACVKRFPNASVVREYNLCRSEDVWQRSATVVLLVDVSAHARVYIAVISAFISLKVKLMLFLLNIIFAQYMSVAKHWQALKCEFGKG